MHSPEFKVLYGSQYGNAEEVAMDLVYLLNTNKIKSSIHSINEFWSSYNNSRENNYVILIISTTGFGEFPDSSKEFWNYITLKSTSRDYFLNWNVTLFGLGDSKYPEYNMAAKKLRSRLLDLGASEFYRYGLGDEQDPLGYFSEYDPWIEGLFQTIESIVFSPSPLDVSSTNIIEPLYHVESINTLTIDSRNIYCDSHLVENYQEPTNFFSMDSKKKRISGKVLSNTRITNSDHFQSVNLLQIELPKRIIYKPSDRVTIYPRIKYATAYHFIKIYLRRDPMEKVYIKKFTELDKKGNYIKEKSLNLSLLDIFQDHLDITSSPTRYFFIVLANFCSDKLYRDKLFELCGTSKENRNLFREYIKTERRSIIEVFQDFDIASLLPLDYLFSIIPPIKKRSYSICSACGWYSRKVWWHIGGEHLMLSPIFFSISSPFLFWTYLQLSLRKHSKTIDYIESKISHDKIMNTNNSIYLSTKLDTIREIFSKIKIEFLKKLDLSSTSILLEENNIIDLCIAKMEYETPLKRKRVGLCSDFLCSLKVGSLIDFEIENGFYDNVGTHSAFDPMILIGPGTGIAVCRSFLQQKYFNYKKHDELCKLEEKINTCSLHYGSILLVTGFRHPKMDYLFFDEFTFYLELFNKLSHRSIFTSLASYEGSSSDLMKSQPLFRVLIAFSRVNPNRKRYIQDELEENYNIVATMFNTLDYTNQWRVNNKTLVIISGRSHPMPSQVIGVLENCLQRYFNLNQTLIRLFLKSKKQQKTFHIDTWG